MNWEPKKFSQIMTVKKGEPITKAEANEGQYPVILGGKEPAYFIDRFNHEGKAIVVSRSGASAGFVSYWNEPIFITDGFLIEPLDGNCFEYVYYLLKYFGKALRDLQNGSAIPHITPKTIYGLKAPVPTSREQERIVSILSAYDNLIEVNNKRIKVLEQMAENLYKEWFVRFRFPGHESVPFENGLPQGWRKAKLKDIAIEVEKPIKAERRTEYQHYLPIDTLPSRRMALLEEDEIDNAESSLLAFEEGDILIGAMRPYFHKVILAPFKGLTRSTCFVVNSINPKYRLYLYLLLFQDSSINYATTVSVGSTMPYARWKDFSRLNIIFPAISVIERFNHYVEPIMTQIIESYSTYCNLSRQRDMLLPRLMSGKLEV